VDDGENEHVVFEVLVADGVEAEAREKIALDRRLDVAGTRPGRPNVRALGDGGQSSIDFGEELVVCASGCKTSCTTLAEFADDVVAGGLPGNGVDGASLDVLRSLFEFGQPQRIDVIVGYGLEALQQAMSQLCTLGHRECGTSDSKRSAADMRKG